MGGGSWNASAFTTYTTSVKNMSLSSSGAVVLDGLSYQDNFKNRSIDLMLEPKGVMRECRDSEEHPNTIPVIIGVDVTGSMSSAGMEVASKIGIIVQDLFDKYDDVQICVMGIGDLSYDHAPIQIGQFESDIRIAEQLDKIYFEMGGGGNQFESYTAAWYYGSRHCDLDCWKRGKKGIIITTGDEPLNPYLPQKALSDVSGDKLQADVETKDLYEEASEKFDIYHISVDDRRTCYFGYKNRIIDTFGKLLPEGHLVESSLDGLAGAIVSCIDDALSGDQNNKDGISW